MSALDVKNVLSVGSGKTHGAVIMVDCGEDFIQKIPGFDPQGGSVDTGMAAEFFRTEQFLVDEQLHPVVVIVHQTQNT